MKPRYLQQETAGRDRWMISYLDVLTILLIFFVAATARTLEKTKPAEQIRPAEQLKVEQTERIGIANPASGPRRNQIQQELEHAGLNWKAEAGGLSISLPQAVLFPPGTDQLNPTALPMLGRIAEVLREIPNKISLAGHADPVPIHNLRFKNNWELAAARSLNLLSLFTTRYGIAESRFSIASYGSIDPTSPNDTPDGRAGNRRVEILILDEAPNPSAE